MVIVYGTGTALEVIGSLNIAPVVKDFGTVVLSCVVYTALVIIIDQLSGAL